MFNKHANNKTTYGVIGLGRFGLALAMELISAQADLMVIDQDEEKVRQLRDYTENAYVVKALDKRTLEETGVQNCDVVVVCVGEHMDTSILTTLHLTSLGVPKVIAKASSKEHGEILERLGAQVVYPERDMAVRLANRLEASQVLDYIQLSEKLNISKLLVPDKMIGRTVLDVNLRSAFGANIIAVENGGSLTEIVAPDYTFRPGDILFVAGSKAGLNKLAEWAK